MRARSTTYRTDDGNLVHLIQFGIPVDGTGATSATTSTNINFGSNGVGGMGFNPQMFFGRRNG
jgi:hypothetical protein